MASKAAGKPIAEKKIVGAGTTCAEETPSDLSKLRLLCLHGFRTSGKIMSQQLALANWSPLIDDLAETVFLDAPWPARGQSDVENKFSGPYYEWHQSNEDRSKAYGLDEATSYISDYISLHGPFDGVLGFSQGASLSAALIGLYEKGMGPQILNVDFLVLVGASRSRATSLKPAYDSAIMCPSLHMIGDKDFLKERGELLAGTFKNPTVIRHPWGHVIPRLGTSEGKIFRDFLLKQLESKLTLLESAN